MAVLLVVVALAAVGCGSGSGSSRTNGSVPLSSGPLSSGTSPQSEPSTTVPDTDSGGGLTSGGGLSSGGGGTGDLPGGTSGKALLSQHKLLDDNGRVAPGPTPPRDPKVNAAICAYVFGTPDQVAKIAKLPGTVKLSSGSGYLYQGGGGEGVACSYTSDLKQVFFLNVWNALPDDLASEPGVTTVELHDGFYGYGGYARGYKGAKASDAKLTTWLKDAGGRVGHGSV